MLKRSKQSNQSQKMEKQNKNLQKILQVEIIETTREAKSKYLSFIFALAPVISYQNTNKEQKKTLLDLLHRPRQIFIGLDFDKKSFSILCRINGTALTTKLYTSKILVLHS
jgi:hypothetical protein